MHPTEMGLFFYAIEMDKGQKKRLIKRDVSSLHSQTAHSLIENGSTNHAAVMPVPLSPSRTVPALSLSISPMALSSAAWYRLAWLPLRYITDQSTARQSRSAKRGIPEG